MKITELMHGDWVSVNCWPVKVVSIGFDLKEETDDDVLVLAREGEEEMEYETYYASALEPIPLTAEILEKNGFYPGGIEGDDEPAVNIDYGKWAYENEDGFDVIGDGADIKYVHELQHALRLCGIEKEIVL